MTKYNSFPKRTCFLMFFLCLLLINADSQQFVKRDIYAKNDQLCVEDQLHFCHELVDTQRELRPLYIEVLDHGVGSSDVSNCVSKIISEESLIITSYNVAFTNGWFDIRISSKATVNERSPGRLHLVSTMGGRTVDWSQMGKKIEIPTHYEILGGRLTDRLEIYQYASHFVLWYPEFGPITDELTNIDILKYQFEDDGENLRSALEMTNSTLFSCNLHTGRQKIELLNWTNGETAAYRPSSKFLQTLNQAHKLSENDIINMCSSMRVARGGFYPVKEEESDSK